MSLWATGLQFFKICHSAELNKIEEATMPVNLYDDCRVSLQRLHKRDGWDIVNSSEGNLNRGIKSKLPKSHVLAHIYFVRLKIDFPIHTTIPRPVVYCPGCLITQSPVFIMHFCFPVNKYHTP